MQTRLAALSLSLVVVLSACTATDAPIPFDAVGSWSVHHTRDDGEEFTGTWLITTEGCSVALPFEGGTWYSVTCSRSWTTAGAFNLTSLLEETVTASQVTVTWTGTANTDRSAISGDWSSTGGTSGTFIATRQ